MFINYVSDLYISFSGRRNVCMGLVLVTPNQVGFRKSEFTRILSWG